MGNRARGLQSRWHRLGRFRSRPVAQPRLPLERRRPRRHQRRASTPVLFARPVERQGPDPQGAHVRTDRQPGQSRRRRQGVLLLPRCHTQPQLDALPVQVSAGGISVRAAGQGERAALAAGAAVQSAGFGRIHGRPLLRRRGALCQSQPRRNSHPRHCHQSRPGGGAAASAAANVVSQRLVVGRPGGQACPAQHSPAQRRELGGPGRSSDAGHLLSVWPPCGQDAVHGKRKQRTAPVECSVCFPVCQRRFSPLRGERRGQGGQSRTHRDQGRRMACFLDRAGPVGHRRHDAVACPARRAVRQARDHFCEARSRGHGVL